MDNQLIYEWLRDVEKSSQTIDMSVNQMKDAIRRLIDENSSLKIENAHLRERLDTLTLVQPEKHTIGMTNLEKLYHSGIHICHNFYGAQRDEMCLLCESLLSSHQD